MAEITFDASGAAMRGYLATPGASPRTPPWPGVVVLHEAFGVNADIREKADRFADRGYLALAPDLYSGGPRPLCMLAAFRAMATGGGRTVEAIDAARAALSGR